ncbi:hypothetical protein 18India_29 [Salmonella phage 18-India]|nr:hypothetical protein 18India_29 [Salmonella phage 18-India]
MPPASVRQLFSSGFAVMLDGDPAKTVDMWSKLLRMGVL